MHSYPLLQCFTPRSSSVFPTIAHLISPYASTALADSMTHFAAVAHAYHRPLRIDEMNTISCGHAAGVGKSFASALWALASLLEMARVGVDGVNIHTFPGSTCELFEIARRGASWRALVEPEYYGLLMFRRAAPPGARLLQVSAAGGSGVRAWATAGRDGAVRIVLINVGGSRKTVAIKLAGNGRTGTLEVLRAGSLGARRGVTLGGQSFGSHTDTGRLAAERTTSVGPTGGDYVVRLPAPSAALLTVR
jgi:hypothetical protein